MPVIIDQLILLAFFMAIITCVVETIKEILKMFPDKIKFRWFNQGLNKKEMKVLSFITAYLTAKYMDIHIISQIFTSLNEKRGFSLGENMEFFIIACLCFVGAKYFYRAFKKGMSNMEVKK